MYTQEQVNTMITDIVANLTDQGRVSELLNDFRTDYTQTLTDHEALTLERDTLNLNNESLRNVNNKMMVQLGDLSLITGDKGTQIPSTEQAEVKREYKDLFSEEGRLK